MSAKNVAAVALAALCLMMVLAPAASALSTTHAVEIHKPCWVAKVQVTGHTINVPGVGSVTTNAQTICI